MSSRALRGPNAFGQMLGQSEAMRRLFPVCESVAAGEAPVVIHGEPGTGKELLAESLHDRGVRASGPFVVFDCAAAPANLEGAFENAEGGTLLIDEIGDLDLGVQGTLLRTIERGEVRTPGSDTWRRVDVRVMIASRRDLSSLVAKGTLREDLRSRFAVARIELPPLRERDGDVPFLAQHFFRRHSPGATVPSDFLERLSGYPFPGNVRELANLVARRAALGELPAERIVPVTVVSDFIDRVVAQGLSLPEARHRVTTELEQRYLRRALEQTAGNVTAAAKRSGIARRYFQLLKAKAGRGPDTVR